MRIGQGPNMHSALTVLWIIADLVTLAATIVVIVALRRAPRGVEDERGFHFDRVQRQPTHETAGESPPVVRPGHVRLA